MRFGRLLLSALVAALGVAGVAVASAGQTGSVAALPDLVQEAPADLHVARTVVGGEPRFRLGFRSGVVNAGSAPLIVEGRRGGRDEPTMTVDQLVPGAGGTGRRVRRIGRMRYTRSPDHRHWHLLRFERYELRRLDGALARPDHKTGFCLGDRFDADFLVEMPGEPIRPPFTSECGLDRPDLLRVAQGLSVGWGDRYKAQLEGQFIDITGVPPGSYDLVHRVNADRKLLEARYDNNVACLGIQVSWPGGPRRSPSVRETSCHHKEGS